MINQCSNLAAFFYGTAVVMLVFMQVKSLSMLVAHCQHQWLASHYYYYNRI